MAKNLTEDEVRDLARDILGLVDSDVARAGVGQLTTFNQLGFAGVADKPDGWYLPNNKAEVALVLETKATRIALGKAQVDEVLKNVRIVQTQYEKVVGVLYNGEDVRVFKGEEEVKTPDKLQHVGYYLSLYTVDSIDKERIYQLTARINNCFSQALLQRTMHRDIRSRNLGRARVCLILRFFFLLRRPATPIGITWTSTCRASWKRLRRALRIWARSKRSFILPTFPAGNGSPSGVCSRLKRARV